MDYLTALDAAPALFEAYTLYQANDAPNEHRWEIEARLLAREPAESIALKLGLQAETVEAYELVFFDVISRLQHPSLITHTVIGRSVQTGLAEREYDGLWKLFGYWGGPAVLDAFIHKFNSPAIPDGPTGVDAFHGDGTKHHLKEKAHIAMLTMKVNTYTAKEILDLWSRLLEMELAAGASGMGGEAFSDNVEAMVEDFSFQAYRPDEDGPILTIAGELEARGVRLRASELSIIGATGEVPTGLVHLMQAMTFPEPEENQNDDQNS
jgi:hypothetical protein